MSGVILKKQEPRFQPVIFRLTYGGSEHAAIGSWLAQTVHMIARDRRAKTFDEFPIDRAPVYAARNLCVKMSQDLKATHICMIDADMLPDCVPEAPLFWSSAVDFALSHDGPCVVSAPTPMTNGCVNIHQEEKDPEGTHLRLIRMDDALKKRGFEKVPAAGSGLILIDMRCFPLLTKPYFAFSYMDDSCSEIVAGEDVSFTARCTEVGIPVYAAWDSWSAHAKELVLRKPQ